MKRNEVGGETMQRKNFYLSSDLADRAETMAKSVGSNLSELIRKALEEYIVRIEREKVEKEIKEACEFYFEEDKEIAKRWSPLEPKVE